MEHKMRRLILIPFLLGCCFFPGMLTAQVDPSYQVGTWADFKACAISYTFDDGCTNQFTKAIPIFDQYGYKLTLFIVTDWVQNWEDLQKAAMNHHEMACHTKSHANLGQLSVEEQKTELVSSVNMLQSYIKNPLCLTMATPYCAQGSDSLAAEYFTAVRGGQGFIESKSPENMMNVSSLVCGNLSGIQVAKDFNDKAEQAAQISGWLVYLLHGLDDDGSYSPISSEELRASLEYLKSNDDRFWVSTFGNQAKYVRERDGVSLQEKAVTKKSIIVSVSDALPNNEWYDYPLSFRRLLPKGWTSALVEQSGKRVSSSVVEVDAVKYIQFNAVPDAGEVVLRKAE